MIEPTLLCVPPAEVAKLLPFAEPLLKSAITHTGIGDYGEIRDGILAGNHLLWLAIDPDSAILAAASTQLQSAPIGRVCVITACGGRSIREWLHLVCRIETYAAAEGCEVVRYFGRPGWLRELDGWKQIGVIADKIITNPNLQAHYEHRT